MYTTHWDFLRSFFKKHKCLKKAQTANFILSSFLHGFFFFFLYAYYYYAEYPPELVLT